MAVRAGQILFDADGFVIDRIQTGGVNNLNVPQTKVMEVGNFHTVGIVRDIPDLSFQVQTVDVSTDMEALVCNVRPPDVGAGTGASPTPTLLDFLSTRPVDITSPFRAGENLYNIVQGVAIPFLNLESVAYRYGLKANAEETFVLRGDSIYYIPGVPVNETLVYNGGGTYAFTFGPAIVYHELGFPVYALSVWWQDYTTGEFQRLFHGQDFLDTSAGFTLQPGVTIPATAVVHTTYGTAPVTQATPTKPYYYPQASPATSVKPAAIRSKDMDIYVSSPNTPNVMFRLTGVQSFDATWKVTLDNDEEFGNPHYVASDFNVADVSGTIGLKGANPRDVIAKIQELAGVPNNEIAGPLTSPPIQIEARLRHPDTHALLKTIYIPDATFTMTPIEGRSNNKLDTSFKWDSNSGVMQVFKGERIGGEV